MKMPKFLNKANFALLAVIIIGAYILIVASDWRLPVINPPDEPVDVPVNLAIYLEDASEKLPVMKITLHLRCEGTVVAERKIELSGYGSILSSKAMNVTYIALGFQSSLAYPPSNNSEGYPTVAILYLNHPLDTPLLLQNSTCIYFPNSGDYAPTCAVHYENEVKTGTFDINSIHVEPESQLSIEKFNRVTIGLSFAIVFFTIIETFFVYLDNKNKKKNERGDTEQIISEIKKINKKLHRIDRNNDSKRDKKSKDTKEENGK